MPGLCAIPDVTHTADKRLENANKINNEKKCDKASDHQKQKKIVIDLNSSGVGVNKQVERVPSSRTVVDRGDDANDLILVQLNNNINFVNIMFKSTLSDAKELEWKTYLYKGPNSEKNLYVNVSLNYVLCDGVRDSFISLLEFAEENLNCSKVFIWLNKSRMDRPSLMRTFMFFGFKTIAPGNTKLDIKQNDDNIMMVYEID